MDFLSEYLIKEFEIKPSTIELMKKKEKELKESFARVDAMAAANQLKVLKAFQKVNTKPATF